MDTARVIVSKSASGQVKARIRLTKQPAPPSAASGGALSKHQNLQIDESTGEVTQKPPILRLPAKRLIREYSSAIERTYGKERCIFLTGTLPGSTVEALREIAKCQKTIQRRLRQWLADCAGSGVAAVLVWEYQKRGALHLHVLCGHQSAATVRQLRRRFRQYWIGLLNRLSDESGVDLFARSAGGSHRMTPNVVRAWAQPVRKSVSAYLAKYLSKSFVGSAPPVVTPISRLWGATSTCRGLLRSFIDSVRTVEVPIEDALTILERIASLPTVAAVPTFRWTRRFSTIEKALVVCGSFSTVEQIWHSCTNSINGQIDSNHVVLLTQSTEQTPPLSYLAGVCALFRGVAIGA